MRPEIESLIFRLEDPANTHLLEELDRHVLHHEEAEARLRLGKIAARLREDAERDFREADALSRYRASRDA